MSLLRFLKDKALFLLLEGAVAVFTGVFLSAFRLPPTAVFFVILVFILANAALLVYEYVKKSSYYKTVLETFEKLDQKYLVAELIEPAGFADSVIFYGILSGAGKSMNDKIAAYRKLTEDYREFIESWVHEIKTPIAAALLTAENNPGPAADSMREDLVQIESLVNKVLYYARSNDVEKDYIIKEIPLKTMVNKAAKRNARYLIQNKFSVHMENLDAAVYTDGKWMDFILDQVITNAVKYAGEGDHTLTFSAEEGREGATLSISDNGIGIPAGDLPRVFEKGFTGGNGRKYAQSTGMGLYLCKKLGDKLGVLLSAYSDGEGRGAAFTIAFPKGSYYMAH